MKSSFLNFTATPLGVVKIACTRLFLRPNLATAAIFVAAVAIHAVVDVPANTAMPTVRLCFRVTVGALENAIVARIGMAYRTDTVGSAMLHVEPRVSESGVQPTRGGMASGASRREARARMRGTGRPRVVLLMATVAVCGQRRVVVVHVTTGARHRRMGSRQREARVVVVKARRRPRGCAVTYIALLGESDGYVVRVVRILKIGQVAGYARGVRQTVI